MGPGSQAFLFLVGVFPLGFLGWGIPMLLEDVSDAGGVGAAVNACLVEGISISWSSSRKEGRLCKE